MAKKIGLIVFILFIGVVSIIGFNFYKNVKTPKSTQTVYNYIPINATAIIEHYNFNHLYKTLTASSIIWSELIHETEIGQEVQTQLYHLDSLIRTPKGQKLLANKNITASLHMAGAKNFNFLFYIPINTAITNEEVLKEIRYLTGTNYTERKYENTVIYTLQNSTKLNFAIEKDVLALSYNTALIEDFIRQSTSKNTLTNNPDFKHLINTIDQTNSASILIQHNSFQKLIELFLNKGSRKNIQQLHNYASWTALDVTLKNNSISLNGFSHANDSTDFNLKLLNNQKPQNIPNFDILPNNLAYVYSYGISNSKEFNNQYKSLLKSSNRFFPYQQYVDELTETFGVDIEEEFINLISNEITSFITEPLKDQVDSDDYIAIQFSEVELAKSTLLKMNADSSTNRFEHSISSDQTIHKTNLDNFFPTLFGSPFFNIKTAYWTNLDSYLIFSNSEKNLIKLIDRINVGKTLSSDANFEEYSDNLQSSSNLFIYQNIARSVHLYPKVFKEEYQSIPSEKESLLRKFEAITIQVSNAKPNLYYNNIYLKHNPVYKQETRTVWETELDSNTSIYPQLVVNHTNNHKEIFIQDNKLKTYLINSAGRVLWTKQLSEKIMSKVHQVDAFKNGKLQLLFNTSSKIYLLDRNGNNVGNFPIKLPTEATTYVAPLDYDNNKKYRLLIGCKDGNVYNYNINGEKVKGWEYTSSDASPIGTIKHFSLSNKDYIIIPLASGNVRVVERSGKDRIKLKNTLPTNQPNYFIQLQKSIEKSFIVACDSNNNATKLYFNDLKEQLSFKDLPKNCLFNFADIDGDSKNEFLFTGDNRLIAFNNDLVPLLDIEIDEKITEAPVLFKFSANETNIGLVTNANIYLINQNGVIVEDFPIAGSSIFNISSLNNDQHKNLVVTDSNLLYLYNIK